MSLSSSLSSPSSIILLAKRKIGSDDDTNFQQTTMTTNKTLSKLKSTRQDTNIQYHSKRIRSSRSTTSTSTTSRRFLTSILLILFLSSCSIPFPFQNKNHPIGFANAAEDDKCASELSYTCPNCGGTQISDCLDCDGFLNTDESHNLCFKRMLFNSENKDKDDHDDHYHYLLNDILGTIVWFIAAGIATACGVGGGGIYVPLGILLLRFSSKPASGLSQASIFGASLGGLIVNVRAKHPNEKITEDGAAANDSENGTTNPVTYYTRPVIDYDMALFLAPIEMAGAVMGVLVQKILPNWLFLGFAGIVLGLTSYKTFTKFKTAYQKDKDERDAKRLIGSDAAAASATASATTSDCGCHEVPTGDNNDNNDQANGNKNGESGDLSVASPKDNDNDNLSFDESAGEEDKKQNDNLDGTTTANGDKLGVDGVPSTNIADMMLEDDHDTIKKRVYFLQQDMRQYPREKLSYFLLLWIGLALITFSKGGKGVDSIIGVECGSAAYGILIAAQFLWTIGFGCYFGWKLIQDRKERLAVSYPYLERDVTWDVKSLRFYGIFTFGAGVVAGLIGIGGGMVLGPLMLVMGIHPRVSSATTATMIVLTSSSVAVMFVTSGLVPWSYAVYFFSVCLCGAFIGKTYIDAYVKRTGMSSILIGILATIIGLATIGCFVIVLTNLNKKNWCFDGFKSFCDEKEDIDGDCSNSTRALMMLLDSTLEVFAGEKYYS